MSFKGKAIYNPSGKAGEYSYWACNFYVGCSNGCEYCYLKKGRGSAILGGDKPVLKKCFKDEEDALAVFEKELKANLSELQKHGLFFSFTTDPMLNHCLDLTFGAITLAWDNNVPVKVLTKTVGKWVDGVLQCCHYSRRNLIAFGFTLTGHDELEPGASSNSERIEAMKKLHEAGFKTFASIEPVIDFESSYQMIEQTIGFCDLYKIGLESGKKYDENETLEFYVKTCLMLSCRSEAKVYWKDSLLKQAVLTRETCLLNFRHNVDREYNIFNQ